MPHIQLLAPLRTWLLSLGVAQQTAAGAAEKIATRLDSGRGLEEEELQLVSAYLSRPNVSPTMDRQLKAIIERQKMFPVPKTPTPGPGPRPPIPFPIVSTPPKGGTEARIPGHTPEWQNQRTGDPGRAYVPQNNQSDLKFVHSLAKRVGGY